METEIAYKEFCEICREIKIYNVVNVLEGAVAPEPSLPQNFGWKRVYLNQFGSYNYCRKHGYDEIIKSISKISKSLENNGF